MEKEILNISEKSSMKSVSKNLNSNISQKLFYLIVLILFLRVDLVFENNTPTGGDMGAHIVAIDTFIKDFMPNFQINGWSNAVSYTHLTLPTRNCV